MMRRPKPFFRSVPIAAATGVGRPPSTPVDEAFRALAKAVVAGDQALPGGPDPEDVRAATLMRESMTHALQTLNDAIEEVQRGAEMLRYANP